MTSFMLDLPDPGTVTWPIIAAGVAALLIMRWVAYRAGVGGAPRAPWRHRAVEAGRLTTRRVLITVAVFAALGVAGIGGARSFNAVSHKFDSPLVPLVADGMIVACTALRLAALTRGWRIPGALVTTYVGIFGTVWLNIDTADGIADAVAHALAPLAYAVLVEMLAHLLRLHMRLAQPAKPRLSALTWFTSPVITTRVWLHLSRTGADDPAAARALVQQVVRMASRLATLCPSHKLWPLDAARAARTACLQTIRDGLLSASQLAALLPVGGRLTPGELLALVDSAALGLTNRSPAGRVRRKLDVAQQPAISCGAPAWLVAYLLGALRTESAAAPGSPDAHRTACTGAPRRPERCTRTGPRTAPHRPGPGPAESRTRPHRARWRGRPTPNCWRRCGATPPRTAVRPSASANPPGHRRSLRPAGRLWPGQAPAGTGGVGRAHRRERRRRLTCPADSWTTPTRHRRRRKHTSTTTPTTPTTAANSNRAAADEHPRHDVSSRNQLSNRLVATMSQPTTI